MNKGSLILQIFTLILGLPDGISLNAWRSLKIPQRQSHFVLEKEAKQRLTFTQVYYQDTYGASRKKVLCSVWCPLQMGPISF